VVCDVADEIGPVAATLPGAVEANTNQFNTAWLYDRRLRASAWRTLDPARAELFYIPYDPFLDNYEVAAGALWRRRLAGVSGADQNKQAVKYGKYEFDPARLNSSSYGTAKLAWLLSISQDKWFTRKGGADHILFVGIHRAGTNIAPTLLDFTLHRVTKLNLELYLYPTRENDEIGRNHRQRYPYEQRTRWMAVAHPSFLHPTAEFVPGVTDSCTRFATNKSVLIAMSFSVKNVGRAEVRQALHRICGLFPPDVCSSIILTSHSSSTEFFTNTIALYKRSKYCLVPGGDTLTSKRFFDAVQACCVPVPVMLSSASWLQLFVFPPFRTRLVGIMPFTITGALRNSSFDTLIANGNATFTRTLPALREAAFGLSYATEDHPVLFDAVDLVVQALAQNHSATLAPAITSRPTVRATKRPRAPPP